MSFSIKNQINLTPEEQDIECRRRTNCSLDTTTLNFSPGTAPDINTCE